ncbi:hypothetical protein SBOR_2416 [Sclerotinia borealis F-4128]|uniref:Uncharacterized protein n=1 Tax=Sclerotinia borealis (strain F-4128) TaxID=1432307 RepID=W9CRP1_SCLBF|nr:hypothetical protein SBOR_2416 [Sclerotinia borealis F-4128]
MASLDMVIVIVIVIVIVALTSFLLGIASALRGVAIKRRRRINQYICIHPDEDRGEICAQRRAYYYARRAIWAQESWMRNGELAKEWLLAEIGKVNVKATSKEKTMPINCCMERWAYEQWEELERRGAEYRGEMAAGKDPNAAYWRVKAAAKAGKDLHPKKSIGVEI